jgi:hypothetical protein
MAGRLIKILEECQFHCTPKAKLCEMAKGSAPRFDFFFSLFLSFSLALLSRVCCLFVSRLLNLQNKNLNNTLSRNIWPVSMIRCWCLPAALLECALVSSAAKSEREMAKSCAFTSKFLLYVLKTLYVFLGVFLSAHLCVSQSSSFVCKRFEAKYCLSHKFIFSQC